MPIEILMPALSPTMTEGNLVKWHKKEGDPVESGDLLAEIETDKATMEVEAVDEGVLGKILVSEGTEQVPVNKCIGLILEEGEEPSALESHQVEGNAASQEKDTTPPKAPSAKDEDARPGEKYQVIEPEAASGKDDAHNIETTTEGRIFASPLARRMAADKGIDLHAISGSGPHGRIVKADVESASSSAGGQTLSSFSNNLPSSQAPIYEDVAPSSMRKVIAKRLLESKQNIPHFYLNIDVCVDEVLSIRKQLNATLENEKITVNDFVIKAIALALREVPEANTAWLGEKIRYYKHADVAVAVAIEAGLITPIIKTADMKSIRHISMEMKSLAQKAREGKLKPEEFQGGSFSLSNLGMFGITSFSAIVNPPQCCILAVGAGEKRAVVIEGEVKVKTMMTCTLSSDHRVVDGKVGAEFLAAFKKYMENPLLMMA